MKLKVCTRKGKQGFWRAGLNFNPNPTLVDVTAEVAEILKNEAMLIVEVVEEGEVKEVEKVEEVKVEVAPEPIELPELTELKFIPPKKGRPKKK